jgi:gliding motility-associated-like protein
MIIVRFLSKLTCILVWLWLIPLAEYAQCTKGLGIPVITETFGAGSSIYAAPLPPGVTDYTYLESQCPDDGQYAIVNYTSGCYNTWPTLTDHTGDPGGYFMIVNAAATPGKFFTRTINGLCPGTTYEFSAWMVNLGGELPPGVTFSIETTDSTVLSTYNTGQIPVTIPVQWIKYGFYFKTTAGISAVILRMDTDPETALGSGGNNFAIDDIAFTPGGPSTQISIKDFAGDTLKIPCNNSAQLLSTVANCYVKNAYQWQISTDNNTWTDIPGAAASTLSLASIAAGTWFYRLEVAEDGNIGNVNCRTLSNTLMVTNAKYVVPKVQNLQAAICSGYYTLPSGKQVDTSGIYTDFLLGKSGCDSLVTTLNLTVATKPTLGKNRSICAGDTTSLNPGIFSSYKWQDGSTNPVYKVTAGGTYSVTVTDSLGCMSSDTVVLSEKYCTTIPVPNAFTPNGDGINDTWNIPPLQYFPMCTVTIFSRWGQLVFSSLGYPKPWDGTYHGKPLPTGTYYYIINLQNNTSLLSGFVALLR